MKKHEFPTLYKLDTTGNTRQWKIWVTQSKKDEPAHIYAEAGLVTTSKGEIGKKVETKPKIITSGLQGKIIWPWAQRLGPHIGVPRVM